MANLTITNRTTSGVVLHGAVFEDQVLTSTAAATWPAGSVLGRITASGKMARFATGASDGSQIPTAVLTTDVVFAAAGDRTERPAISGQVRKGKLLDAAGAALTTAAIDQLRDFTVLALTTHQLSAQDNQ